jgi:hypothetical protein
MQRLVSLVLVLVALVHALPLAGVAGGGQLAQLYGIALPDPEVALLLRHRAVLFGLLAGFLGYAALRPDLHRMALTAGVVSVASFLLLANTGGAWSPALARVVRVDWAALALLLFGLAVHLRRGRQHEAGVGQLCNRGSRLSRPPEWETACPARRPSLPRPARPGSGPSAGS